MRQQFNSDVQELIFQNNTECTFQLYLFIIKLWNKDKVGLLSYNADAAELRRILWKQYSKFVELYKEKIFIILSDQGKKRIVERLRQGAIEFEDLIMSEEYYLTNLDVMMLNLYYRLPIVFISLKNFRENNENILLLEKNPDEKYYFVKQGADKRNEPRKISLLFQDEEYLIGKDSIKKDLLDKLELEERAEKLPDRITEFFDTYVPLKRKPAKKKKLVIVE